MKTVQTLESPDRVLFGVAIRQKTDGMFSLTDLDRAYNVARIENGWSDRNIYDVLNNKITHERIYYLLKEKGLINSRFMEFMDSMKQSAITTLKTIGAYKTTGRGENKQVVCNPYIWSLLAMELNPKIFAIVAIWLTDSLIFDRVIAGDDYYPMNKAINSIIKEPKYYVYAMEINLKVFGKHITGIRNLASAEELRNISKIESFVKSAIDRGWIKTHNQIIEAIQTFQI